MRLVAAARALVKHHEVLPLLVLHLHGRRVPADSQDVTMINDQYYYQFTCWWASWLTTTAAGTSIHKVARDVEAELLHVRVVFEVRLAHQVVDLALAVWGGPGRGLDHGAGLHVRQLLDAPLPLHDVADLQRQVGVLVLLAHLERYDAMRVSNSQASDPNNYTNANPPGDMGGVRTSA